MADLPPEHPPPPPAAPPVWGAPPTGWAASPAGWGGPHSAPPGWDPPPPHAWGAGQVGSGRFRSMSVGEVLDATFSLYRRNFVLIAAISAVVQIPYALLVFALYEVTGLSTFTRSPLAGLGTNPQQLTQGQLQLLENQVLGFLILAFGVLLLALFVVLPLAEAATTRAVSDRYLDRDSSVGRSYGAALRRLRPLVWQSFILFMGALTAGVAFILAIAFLGYVGGAATGAGFAIVFGIALIVAAIFVYVRTSLAAPAIVLEGLSGWNGLLRSWHLVRGLGWRMLGIRLLLVLIAGLIEVVIVSLFSLPGSGLDANGQFVVNQVASAIAAVFIGPITYVAVTLLYYDTRIRKEGFDIEMLAHSL